ncbi:hypothetical protein EZV62_003632 [Acer yangbiense]|uniref:Uncharacterized protein n=1 Tax=Acer yangbiense TaxID=1000413 RepID=A0A5C7IHA0_9ROSI|nr:hypothetical protein EZV62_003632 [Acer yangbiense]
MKALECFLRQKRWSNNISQFSLLSFIKKEKPLPCPNILKHLRLVKKLEKQGYADDMEIPKNLKTLLGLYLREKEKHSQIGPTNPVDRVGLNFTEELEKSILVWHVATNISMPTFEELLTVSETYLNQRQLVNEEDNNNDIKIFLKNRLPGLLRKLNEQALEERWKIISWTWLEMLPYAAIKCRGIQHAQHLKNGGEFLSHVSGFSVLLEITHEDLHHTHQMLQDYSIR